MKKKASEYFGLPHDTMIEVVKILKGRYWKKEMKYGDALKLLDEKRAERSPAKYRIYQLGFSQFKT